MRGVPGPPFNASCEARGSGLNEWMERLAESVTRWLGSNGGIATAAGIVAIWAICGPIFHYSETWQLLINTGTTIVTFLVVFLLQRSQNKESRAIQLKLNEIVAAISGASNRLIGAEQMSEAELARLASAYQQLMAITAAEGGTASRTIEDMPDDDAGARPAAHRRSTP